MTRRASRSLAVAVALALSLLARAAHAQAPDWNALSAEDVIQVLTHDPGGELRETSVWLAVVDGQGYLRTGETSWRANLDRDPDAVVRIAGREYPLRAQQVTDPELLARVNTVFREKYGFQDRVVGWFASDAGRYYAALVARPPGP